MIEFSQQILSLETFERVLEVWVGLYFVYFGLNGFFNWQKIPPQSPEFEKFIQALNATGFLLPMVKVVEIAAGACLLAGLWSLLAVLVLAPIVFVIVTSQLQLNFQKGWRIAFVTLIPFALLMGLQAEHWSFLWTP